MGKARAWLVSHWQIIIAVVGAGTVVYREMTRKPPSGKERLDVTSDAIQAEAQVEKIAVEQGAAAAIQAVTEQFHDQLAHLKEDEQKKAVELLDDPVALSKFLTNKPGA